EGNYSVFDSKTTTHYVDPFNGGDYLPLLINTNVPPEALREELKNRVFLVVDAVKELRAYYSDDIRNLTTADIYDRTIPLSEQYRKVCRFVMESGKVASIVSKLIVSKDCNQIGKTLYRLGKEMRETLDLSCPEVDWVIKRCAEIPGCSGAFFVFDTTSLSVLAIVSKSSLEELNEKLTEFEKIFGYKVEVSTFEPKGSAWISTEE
ncbi:MAG: hypothetical protein HUK24_09085, partial [Sphaerochaetaceae bacterium]|nr:hypothetical protein [Sphaerochaetaceae bacterium]